MSFGEMEMVDILKRTDYYEKYGPYSNPNIRKAKIMTKVVKSLQKNFGVQRSKDQLRKRWSDLKLREHDQYKRIKRVLQKRREDSGSLRTPGTPHLPKKAKFQHQKQRSRRRRKERSLKLDKLSPQQVMWKKNHILLVKVPRS
ncbi:uncharacterized protein LOC143983876 [Lithobates pipiens]